MEEKYARMKDGAENPFIDPDGYKAYISEREQAFRAELAKQQAGGVAGAGHSLVLLFLGECGVGKVSARTGAVYCATRRDGGLRGIGAVEPVAPS